MRSPSSGIDYEEYLRVTERDEPQAARRSSATAPSSGSRCCWCSAPIAEKENVEVTDAERGRRGRARRAQRYPRQPRSSRTSSSPRGRTYIRSPLRRSKVVETLIDRWIDEHPEFANVRHTDDQATGHGADDAATPEPRRRRRRRRATPSDRWRGDRPAARGSDTQRSAADRPPRPAGTRPRAAALETARDVRRCSCRWSSRPPAGASAPTTSTAGCCRTGSSSSATPIEDHMANLIIAQLLFLEAEDPERDISLYINSPGGVVTAGLAIYDTMQYLRAPVSTICIGMAASHGVGAAGRRRQGQALRAAEQPDHDPPGLGRLPRQHAGRVHPGQGARAAQQALNHEILADHTGQTDREDQQGHRAGLLHVPRTGQGLWHHRRGLRRARSVADQRGRRARRPLGGEAADKRSHPDEPETGPRPDQGSRRRAVGPTRASSYVHDAAARAPRCPIAAASAARARSRSAS